MGKIIQWFYNVIMQNIQIHPDVASQIYGEGETKNKDKQNIHTALFWLLTLATLMIAGQNVFFWTTLTPTIKTIISSTTLAYSYTIIGIISCKYGPNKWEIFHLCILFDNIFLATLVAFLGLGGLTYILNQEGLLASKAVLYVFSSLQYVILAGAFRILLAFCFWKRWQVICCKFTLVSSASIYFYIALNMIINGLPEKFPLSNESYEKLVELSFLYVFGLFSFYSQIFSKLTELDGTAQLQHHYSILPKDPSENEQEPKENDIKNQTVFKINSEQNQSEHMG